MEGNDHQNSTRPSTMNLSIHFSKQVFPVHASDFPSLVAEIERVTGVPAAEQKLFSGKANLRSLDGVADGAVVKVLRGAPVAERGEADRAVTFHANRERNLPVSRFAAPAAAAVAGPSARLFGRIEVLQGESEQSKAVALAMLTRISEDPGVVAVMKKRGWTVGVLGELPKVETSSEKLLGLNTNRGQKIELRLRFDDQDGFRSYQSVWETMMHELCHNKIGPHNDEFHALCREITREAQAADWRRSEGHAATAESTHRGFETRLSSLDSSSQSAKLGGKRPEGLTPAQAAAQAAIMRLSKEEEAQTKSCGTKS